MAREHSYYGQQRWINFHNQSGSIIPAFGAIELTGFGTTDLIGTMPTGRPDAKIAFNSHIPVPEGYNGEATVDLPTWALTYETHGVEVGATAGSFQLTRDGTGFCVLGGNIDGRAQILGTYQAGGSADLVVIMEENLKPYGYAKARVLSGFHGTRLPLPCPEVQCGESEGGSEAPIAHKVAVWVRQDTIIEVTDYAGYMLLRGDKAIVSRGRINPPDESESESSEDDEKPPAEWFIIRSMRQEIWGKLVARDDYRYTAAEVVPDGEGNWRDVCGPDGGRVMHKAYHWNRQRHNCQGGKHPPVVRLYRGLPPELVDVSAGGGGGGGADPLGNAVFKDGLHTDYDDWFFGYEDGEEERSERKVLNIDDRWHINEVPTGDCEKGIIIAVVGIKHVPIGSGPGSGSGSSSP